MMRRLRALRGGPMLRAAMTMVVLAAGGTAEGGATYHVRPGGDDRLDGRSAATAWRTVGRVNSGAFEAGDQVLFERGGEWREALVAPSSGVLGRPIAFGAYGEGAKPRFWGSDLLDRRGFRPAAGGVFEVAVGRAVYSVLVDHRFLRSARLVTRSDDPAVNREHVRSHPGTWDFRDGILSLNAGGGDPRADGRAYSAVVREDLVASNGKDHLTFRDLVVDETARFDSGYGFRIQGSSGVRLEGSEAYRCGKHHFGVINSTGFVGVDLVAAQAMPDQGAGGASAYVTYSDRTRKGDTSEYLRCRAEDPEDAGTGGRYPAFVTHGEGVGSILLEGFRSRGGDVALGNGESGAEVRVRGGRLDDAVLDVHGEGIVVDGLTVAGARGGVVLEGAENILQNMLIIGGNPGFAGHQAAIAEGGRRNLIRFCTVVMDPAAPDFDAAISLKRPGTGLRWHGNILLTKGTVVRAWFPGFDPGGYEASANFYAPAARFDTRFDGRGEMITLDRWRALGLDADSLVGDPRFLDPARADYALGAGSPAVDAAGLDPALLRQVPVDLPGKPRLRGRAFDMGAFESPGRPSPAPR